jgi:hypothetical protein
MFFILTIFYFYYYYLAKSIIFPNNNNLLLCSKKQHILLAAARVHTTYMLDDAWNKNTNLKLFEIVGLFIKLSTVFSTLKEIIEEGNYHT